MLTLLLGGARSGKSALAVELARAQARPVTFVATATATDPDMQARIERHRAERPPGWRTIEDADLDRALDEVAVEDCLLIDCLSIWTGRAMAAHDHDEVVTLAGALAARAQRRPGLTIAVSNEVGMGVHPVSALGREYRDVHGHVNAAWAREADRAVLVVAGRTLELG